MSERVDAKCRDNLAQLVAPVVAHDEEVVIPCPAAADQQGIAGQDQPPLLPRPYNQPGIVQRRGVGDVTADDPEPAGQLPEHRIGEKSLLHGYQYTAPAMQLLPFPTLFCYSPA